MPNANTITWTLRSCRESKGYSQEYMAEMLDIGQSAYANLESGKTTLSLERLLKITEILELDIHEVLDSLHSEGMGRRLVHTDTKEVYERLVHELKNEVEFLRGLVAIQAR